MDDFINSAIEEIALEGRDGANFKTFLSEYRHPYAMNDYLQEHKPLCLPISWFHPMYASTPTPSPP